MSHIYIYILLCPTRVCLSRNQNLIPTVKLCVNRRDGEPFEILIKEGFAQFGIAIGNGEAAAGGLSNLVVGDAGANGVGNAKSSPEAHTQMVSVSP
jgi:hypothetical protein